MGTKSAGDETAAGADDGIDETLYVDAALGVDVAGTCGMKKPVGVVAAVVVVETAGEAEGYVCGCCAETCGSCGCCV